MQTKQAKYEAAVKRNIKGLPKHAKHPGATLDQVKKWVGIRVTDTRYDDEITGIIKQSQGKEKAKTKEVTKQ